MLKTALLGKLLAKPILLAAVAIGVLPQYHPQIQGRPPELVPGYPPRQLLTIDQDRNPVRVWGWLDTESNVHFVLSENPHYKPAQVASTGANFGVVAAKFETGGNFAGSVTTNDPTFAARYVGDRGHVDHDAGTRCPGPGPCPYPNAPNSPNKPKLPVWPDLPGFDRSYLEYAGLGLAALLLGAAVLKRRSK